LPACMVGKTRAKIIVRYKILRRSLSIGAISNSRIINTINIDIQSGT
jgi:hypothetical protein